MRIGIIGHFGGNEKFNDGQTIKTITLYNAFERRKPNDVFIDKIDTYYIKRKPTVFFIEILKCLLFDKKIVALLSNRGRATLFPVLHIFSRLFRKDIYHYAIGGRLAREVKEHRMWRKYVNSFKGNWMESTYLSKQLNSLGVENAIYMPNFKTLDILPKENLKRPSDNPYRFCIFSRVMKEKGVEDAIDAVKMLNKKRGKDYVALDIYGPIDSEYKNEFFDYIEQSGEACHYCGVVPAEKSVEALKDYYMLLFPTHWKHEGIPGTIIDAFSAGVPIIARRWAYCDEMITHGINGLVYDFDHPELLINVIEYAVSIGDEILEMKKACLEKANMYSENTVMKDISREMDVPFKCE